MSKVVYLEGKDRVTTNVLNQYEVANAITHELSLLIGQQPTTLDPEDLYIPISTLTNEIRMKIDPQNIKEKGGEFFVKLCQSVDIAKAQINKRRSSFTVIRDIEERDGIAYKERLNVNDAEFPLLSYFDHLAT